MDPQDALLQLSKAGNDEVWFFFVLFFFVFMFSGQDLDDLLGGDYKVDIEKKDSLGNTALHYAAGADHTKCVKILLEKGKANAEAKNKQGETPLHKVNRKRAKKTKRGDIRDLTFFSYFFFP